MSYCRWSDGHLYAYRGADGYYVHVTGPAVVEDRVNVLDVEQSAQALLARVLWLGERDAITLGMRCAGSRKTSSQNSMNERTCNERCNSNQDFQVWQFGRVAVAEGRWVR